MGRLLFSLQLRISLSGLHCTQMSTITRPTIDQEYFPLSELREREEAVVHVTELDFDERQSLAAMGLQDDTSFRLCQQGQPCIIQVEATRLGLSREVTSRIMVRRCDVCNEV